MRISRCVIVILCIYATSALAVGPTAEDLLKASEELSAAKHFDGALQLLARAARLEPGNIDVKIEIARVHSWQGRYDEAQTELEELARANPDNVDIPIARAHVDFYRGNFDLAQNEFSDILDAHPDAAEAADGLKLARDAEKDLEGFLWQLDAGYERSNFARQPSTPWNDEFIQLSRSFDHGATAVHGRFEYDDQFETTDSYYELGVDHRFTPWANAYLYDSHTVDASFKPRWRTEPGGNLRVFDADGDLPAAWLTLDIKEDAYNGNIDIATVDPGLRFEKGDWALSPNLVMVKQWGRAPLFGWSLRLDGPVTEGWRFSAGYADAPETENAVTVYTASLFGGLAWDIDEAHTLALGYTHDDRQNSWIRHVVDIDFTQRF